MKRNHNNLIPANDARHRSYAPAVGASRFFGVRSKAPRISADEAARQMASDPEFRRWRDEIRHAIPRGRP